MKTNKPSVTFSQKIINTECSGLPLTQELLNSIMREPGENPRASAPVLPACPQCGERYCGDGAQLCTECEKLRKDAERYRYIKKGGQWIGASTQTGFHVDGEELDGVIDSEMEQ